jgi:hypothetical protein
VTEEQLNANWLKTLADEAATAIGPIAQLLVERAVARGASFEDVRRELADQMHGEIRRRFVEKTEALAERAHAQVATSMPPVPVATGSRSAQTSPTETLDRSDPAFVAALTHELAGRLGDNAEALIAEAAHRCRTRMQLCLRLANAVDDPDLKAYLSRRALGNGASQVTRGV